MAPETRRAMVALLATPLLVGSPMVWLPSVASAACHVLRAFLEDGVFVEELEGYREFAEQIRFRLTPGIW